MAKMLQRIQPTIRQKKAIALVVENRGASISGAMREAGYPETTAKNPKNLTESNAWNALMDEYLSDADLAKAHKKLLEASSIEKINLPYDVTEEEARKLFEEAGCKLLRTSQGDESLHCWFKASDPNALKAGLDLAYKLKGKYAPEKFDGTLGVILAPGQAEQLMRARANRVQ